MFVADVAAGNAFTTYEKNLQEQWCPPQGYNSVVAEVRLCTPLECFHVVYSRVVAVRLEYREIITLTNIFGPRSADSHISPLFARPYLRNSHLLVCPCIYWRRDRCFLLLCFRIICLAPFPGRHFTVSRKIVNTVIAVHSSLNVPPVAFAQRNMLHRRCLSSPAIVIFCARSLARRREKTMCTFPDSRFTGVVSAVRP